MWMFYPMDTCLDCNNEVWSGIEEIEKTSFYVVLWFDMWLYSFEYMYMGKIVCLLKMSSCTQACEHIKEIC